MQQNMVFWLETGIPVLKRTRNEYLKKAIKLTLLNRKYNKTGYFDGNLGFALVEGAGNEYLNKAIERAFN